ncbi:MAG: NAD-dependent epimerase/dehydratase family protein [Rhodocyclaceae bacterium]|nr:NAD-dependent epimerase/dehydratase family protein [Rhodocyclaceae bacterium]
MKRILIVGSGDVARRALPWLTARFRVFAVVRREDERASLRRLGAVPLLADLDQPATLRRLAGIADFVLHFAPPPAKGDDDPRTRRILAVLQRGQSVAQGLVYISTTGVYGDCEGAMVSETRPLSARTGRAVRRVAAEARLRRFGRHNGCRVVLLRAPGIYAPERLSLGRLLRGDPVLQEDDDVFTNHIHADDLARVACFAIFRGKHNRAYNVCDNSHLKMGDYFDLIARIFGLAPPPRVSRAEAQSALSSATLSFMSESRRLVNRRMHDELRVNLRYPDVREGLMAARATIKLVEEE